MSYPSYRSILSIFIISIISPRILLEIPGLFLSSSRLVERYLVSCGFLALKIYIARTDFHVELSSRPLLA